MHHVYILRSANHPSRLYIGCADDIERRIVQHNRGDSTYSRTYAPWTLEASMTFKHRQVAQDFEHYLKSGSGHAVLKRRFLPSVVGPNSLLEGND